MRASLAAALVTALALAVPSPSRALRPDTPGTTELFRYDATDVVESYGSPGGDFLVHFTRAGANAVPLRDDDASGTPDHVERVAEIYDEVLAFYRDVLGYRTPLGDEAIADDGGDGRFDVYLLDFGGAADGSFRSDACGVGGAMPAQCIGYMVQENDFAAYGYPSIDYANRLLASHEFFHAVQAAYDSGEGSVLAEGTAVWASEAFDPSFYDLEGFADGYLDNTDRPIDRPLPGPVDPFSYGAGIFFRFLEERFGRDVIRELLEATETDDWLPALDDLLLRDHASSFAEAFREFDEWNLFTGERADPSRSYENGASYPLVHVQPVELPYSASPLRVFYASAQYFGADPGARGPITAELVGDTAGLELSIAVRRGTTVELATGAVVDASGADEVIVVVENPAREGESRRPGLCIGTATEVAACRAALEPMPDAGVDVDGGVLVDTDAGAPVPASSGCTCRAIGASSARTPMALLGVIAALALVRRRAR